MTRLPEAISLLDPSHNEKTGQYGRDFVSFESGQTGRIEMLPSHLGGPAVEVFLHNSPFDIKQIEGMPEHLVVLIEDDEFASKAIEFAVAEAESLRS